MVAALILAAGESKRMAKPKALLRIGQETFAESIARKCRECGIEAVYVVAGPHYEQLRKELLGKHRMELILNLRYREGQLSSLKEGLRSLPTNSTEALVWPVDQPLVKAETVKKMLEISRSERKHVTIPVYQGRRGHPVIYDVVAIQTLLSLRSHQTAKEIQAIYATGTSLLEVDDPAVLVDIDTPKDYQQHIKGSGL